MYWIFLVAGNGVMEGDWRANTPLSAAFTCSWQYMHMHSDQWTFSIRHFHFENIAFHLTGNKWQTAEKHLCLGCCESVNVFAYWMHMKQAGLKCTQKHFSALRRVTSIVSNLHCEVYLNIILDHIKWQKILLTKCAFGFRPFLTNIFEVFWTAVWSILYHRSTENWVLSIQHWPMNFHCSIWILCGTKFY